MGDWIRNAADEKAKAAGYFMDESRGEHICNFIESNLCLYEGDYAGKPVRLMDWQIDLFYRLFGWVTESEFYGREIRRFRIASCWLPKKNWRPMGNQGITYTVALGIPSRPALFIRTLE